MLCPAQNLSGASICMKNSKVTFLRGFAFISKPLKAVLCFDSLCPNTSNIYTDLDHQQHSAFTPPIPPTHYHAYLKVLNSNLAF